MDVMLGQECGLWTSCSALPLIKQSPFIL